MIFENKAPAEADDNQGLADNAVGKASTQPITRFTALPPCLLASDDELQPDFTHTPRPKHSI